MLLANQSQPVLVENAAEASKTAQFQTKIVRVINDEDDMETATVSCRLIKWK